MITIFGASPTRGLRVLWMLEEMGLDYEVRPVDLKSRRQDQAFMAVCPSGAMPGLVDGEVQMMESVAIMEYLAARYGPTPLAPEITDPDYPRYLQFLHYGEASLAAPLNIVVASRLFAPETEKQNWGVQVSIDMVAGRTEAVAAQLRRTPYLAGQGFTAADISCAYAFGLMDRLGLADRLDGVITAYMDRLQERPAFKRAMRHHRPLV